MQPVTAGQARKILFWAAVAANLLMVGALLLSKVSLEPKMMAYCYSIIGGLVALQRYVYWRRMTALYPVLDALVGLFLVTIPLLYLSYVAMSFNMPLVDEKLARLDAAMGFDWFAFIAFIDHRPWLAQALGHAYTSFHYQLLFLPAYFALRGNPTRTHAIVFCYALVVLICCLVSVWYPALGTYVSYGVDVHNISSINPSFGYSFLEQFHSVRQQPDFLLDFQKAEGLITFPSAHAGVAALCLWAAWESRLLRIPFLVLDIAMATSAVSHGSHYLIDVVAGIGIAGIAVSITTLLFYRQSTARSFVLDQVRHVAARWQARAASPAAAAE
jgi:membrane-associated phospholipid phosphatase